MTPNDQVCLHVLLQIAEKRAPVALLRMHPETYRLVSSGSIVLAGVNEVAGIPVTFDRRLEVGSVRTEAAA